MSKKAKGLLSRDAILNTNDVVIKGPIDVPEWGGYVFVKSMTATERDAYEQSMFTNIGKDQKTDYKNLRSKMCVRTICDKGGNTILQESDIEALGKKSSKALDRVFTVAQNLNGMSNEDVKALMGNSESGQTESSNSD